MGTAIVWFRRDLRLGDHAALAAALARGGRVVPVYVHSPDEEGEWAPGAASRWWLHRSLLALDAALRARGARLVVLRGPTVEALESVARTTGADAVHWQRRYEPGAIALDSRVKAQLRALGLAAESHAGALLFEPWTVRTGADEPYRVFTPFWRTCAARLGTLPPPRAAPASIPFAPTAPDGIGVEALGLAPAVHWDAGLAAEWTPGEAGALARLEAFARRAVADYGTGRDRPDLAGTSRLAPHLHFGELSPRQALAAILHRDGTPGPGGEAFVRQLGWREFAHHVLYHFPHTATAPLNPAFAAFEWREDAAARRAWQRGLTGYPLVDAGMRELWRTGWMHNRVRMVVASLLAKNLGLHWHEGLRWFHDTLVDADLANNALGWQWVAGTGADAAPYYRIFNPTLQAERYDPDRAYLRRWVPELARLPDAWIHRPAEAPASVLRAAGVVLGSTYPAPIVDFRASRDDALARWSRLRGAVPRPALPDAPAGDAGDDPGEGNPAAPGPRNRRVKAGRV